MTHQELANFIWQIADLLRGPYRPPQYERVMLPFVVLRRFDCVLAQTKAKVVAEYEKLKGGKITGDALDPRLNKIAGKDFRFHNHSPLDLEKLKGDPDHIDKHLVSYINGFSANVRRIFEFFEIGAEIEKMHEANILYLVVMKFCDVDLHPDKVPNEEMGKLFEHLIRKFNEQANETAGDHFTPREVIHLMVDLLFIDDDAVLSKPNVVRKLLDPACGTGGMLTQALNYIDEHDQAAELWVFGQDYNKRSYAVAASDLLLKGRDNSEIAFGDSLVDDQFGPSHAATHGRFDYLLANPPFGVDWKRQQKDITREHEKEGFGGRFGAGLPRVNDGALLFLQHMISKFESVDKGGARLAIVFNGSPLFTGGAGSGESEIRKWIIENDWLEAIVALPEQMYFNTGIGTYIWVVTNRKEKRRKGKIQLVDARDFYIPMRRSLGDKRRKIGEGPAENEPSQVAEIVKTYGTCKQIDVAFIRDNRGAGLKWISLTNGGRKPTPEEGQTVDVRCISKVFDNADFGYRRVTVDRPLRLRYQMTTERKSRFLDALPHLLDDVQAIDKQFGRDARLDWNSVRVAIDEFLDERNNKPWKKGETKLFRDVFCDVDPTAESVVAVTRKAQKKTFDQVYGWFPNHSEKQDVRYEPDPKLRDFENIPLKEDEVEYFRREVLPHVPDAWIDADKTKVGYEINFNRHFYEFTPPRPLEEIDEDLRRAERLFIPLLNCVTDKTQQYLDQPLEKDRLSTSTKIGDRITLYEKQRLKYAVTINDEALSEDTPSDFEIKYVDISNVDSLGRIHDIVDYTFDRAPSRARRMVRDGDVIISTVRTYLQAIAPIQHPPENLIVSTGFAVLRPCASQLDPGYCKYVLRESRFLWEVITRSVGVSYPAINASDLGDIKIPLPPLETQRKIVKFLDTNTAYIDSLITGLPSSLEGSGHLTHIARLLWERRSALITAAVTGQLTVET